MRSDLDLFNSHDVDSLLADAAEDFEWVTIGEHPQAGTMRGPAIRAYLDDWFEMLEGVQVEAVSIEERGDKVLAAVRVTGNARQGGAEIGVSLSTVTSFRDGQPVRHQEFLDPAEARRAFEAEKDV